MNLPSDLVEIKETNDMLIKEVLKTYQLSLILVELARQFPSWEMYISRGKIRVETKSVSLSIDLKESKYTLKKGDKEDISIHENLTSLYWEIRSFQFVEL